jgi:enhancer of mRNA-decapping protein 4
MSMPGEGLLALLRKKSEPEEPKPVDSPKFGARSSAIDALAQSYTGNAGKKQNQAKGRSFKDLESDTYTFDYDDFQPGEAQPELICQPIARVPTEFNPHISKHSLPDRLIAVNDQYICYGLKQGHIRVLSRATGAKALLKGHNSPIADITIHPETNALAAGGKDGHLLVWHLQGEEDIVFSVLVDATVQSADRVLVSWISDGTGLAVATGEHIGIISFGTDLASAPPRIDGSGDFEDLSDAGVFCTVYSKHGTFATALACSPSISSLAIGYLDGSVHELSLEIGRKGLTPGAQARLKHKRDMFTGESLDSRGLPITFVYYIAEGALVYGYRDAVIMPHGFILYLSAPTSSDSGYTADKNVPFVIAGVVPESNLVILADPKHNMFITVHYDESLTMDYIARFSVTMPVLSFTPHFKKDEDGSGGGEVEINTVQTEAVQQYMLSPELCYGSGSDAVAGGEGKKEEIRAAGMDGDVEVLSHPIGAATAMATAVAAAMGKKKTSESGSGAPSPGPAMSSASSEPPTKDAAATTTTTTTTNGVSDSFRITPQPPPRLLTPADLLLGEDSPALVSPLPPTVSPPPSAATTKKILKKQGSSTAIAAIPTSATTTTMMRSEPISGDSADALRADLARYHQQMDAKFAETMKLQLRMMETIAQLVIQVKTELPRTVTKSVTTALNKSLEGMSKDVAAEAAASLEKQLPATVAAGLAKPIQDSFKKTFEKQLVPAFENAVQSGFGQMNKTLSQGLDQHLKGHGNEAANLANQLKESLTLANNIRMSGGGGGGASSESGTPRGGSKSASGGGATSRDVKAELLALAKAGRYEDAFVQGLSLQDVPIIAWLCSQVDAATVLNAEPLPLSQTVLLSLLQQVSAGMGSSGTSLSSGLSWVREAAIQLNPKDASVAAHVKPVLEQVLGSLQSILPKAKGGDSQACKLAMHVVKSQMM